MGTRRSTIFESVDIRHAVSYALGSHLLRHMQQPFAVACLQHLKRFFSLQSHVYQPEDLGKMNMYLPTIDYRDHFQDYMAF